MGKILYGHLILAMQQMPIAISKPFNYWMNDGNRCIRNNELIHRLGCIFIIKYKTSNLKTSLCVHAFSKAARTL